MKKSDYLTSALFFVFFAGLFLIAAAKCVLVGSGVLPGNDALAWGALACLPACSMLSVVKHVRRTRRLDAEHQRLLAIEQDYEARIARLLGGTR